MRLGLPVLDGRIAAGLARAEAVAAAAEQRSQLAELQVAADLDRALSAHAEALARATALDEAASRFAEVVRVELLRLEVGVGIQRDYLAAEADLLAARAALVDARHAAAAARAELARVAGELTPQWLRRELGAREVPPAGAGESTEGAQGDAT